MRAWLLSTWLGRWLACIGAALLAIGAALVVGIVRGKREQRTADEAKDAQQAAEQAVVAQQTYADASHAAAQVQAAAAKQPPPDVDKRDDLDNTF